MEKLISKGEAVDRPWWEEILLPPTDRVVAIQGSVFLVLAIAALTLTWRWASVRLVVIGLVLILAGLLGLRAAH